MWVQVLRTINPSIFTPVGCVKGIITIVADMTAPCPVGYEWDSQYQDCITLETNE